MKTVIFANGVLSEVNMIKSRVKAWSADRVICADGAIRNAARLGLAPDVIIGDMDSLGQIDKRHFPRARFIRYQPEKDESDLELALLLAAEEGASEMVIIGAMGGRIDMTLANIFLLTHPVLNEIHVELWEGHQTAWLIRSPGGPAMGATDDTLSLLPLGGDARGVTTEGLRYPLRDETLAHGPARGVSNVIETEDARITIQSGQLLAVHTPGRA